MGRQETSKTMTEDRRYKDGPLCWSEDVKWESKFLACAAEQPFQPLPFLPVSPNNGGAGSGREDAALGKQFYFFFPCPIERL